MRNVFPDLRGVLREGAIGEDLMQAVRNLNGLGVHGLEGNQAVFFNCSWENAVTFVIDVLADDVDSPGCPGDEIGFRVVFLLECGED
jgi:hypothetical protein